MCIRDIYRYVREIGQNEYERYEDNYARWVLKMSMRNMYDVYTYVYVPIYIRIYIYLFVRVCVCSCVCRSVHKIFFLKILFLV